MLEEFRNQSILEAALRVISRRGVAAATMQEVADEAGIAKGTIYLYFKSREELVERTAELVHSQLDRRMREVPADPRDALSHLRRLVETKIAFFDEHREFLRAYLATCQNEAERGRRRQARYEQYLRRLAEFLAQAMDAGALRRGDPDRLALFLSEGINAVIRRRLAEHNPRPPQEDVDFIASTILEGLAVRQEAQ